MMPDIVDLRAFYDTRLGVIAQHNILRIIHARWENCAGLSVLGLGFATPFLDRFCQEALRTLAFMPADMGVVNWPPSGASATALVEADRMPLPDGSIDRFLLVHALEASQNPRELLDEIWRILTPGGRLIVVVPNRRGLWARFDTTPFGNGQPFSRRQLREILRDSLFSPMSFDEALYVPPSTRQLILRSAPMFETLGVKLGLPGAGVFVVEATKLLYRPISLRNHVKSPVQRLHPVLIPQASRRSRCSDARPFCLP